jgi:prefoldin alpha subunit
MEKVEVLEQKSSEEIDLNPETLKKQEEKLKSFVFEGFKEDYENPHKIEKVHFIEKIEEECPSYEKCEEILKTLQDQHTKYRRYELGLSQSKYALKNKIPEIEKTLEAVLFLKNQNQSKKPTLVNFQLTDGIFIESKIKETTDKVAIWLGANIMVEYNFEEAIKLLEENKSIATKSLLDVEEDIAFVKDQLTITEVNISRVYNRAILMKKDEFELKK